MNVGFRMNVGQLSIEIKANIQWVKFFSSFPEFRILSRLQNVKLNDLHNFTFSNINYIFYLRCFSESRSSNKAMQA